mgnify:FL=1
MAMMKNTGMLWIGQIPVDWELGKVKYAFNRKKEKSTAKDPIVLSLARAGVRIRDISTNEGQLAASYEGYNPVEPNDLLLNPMDLVSGANCSISKVSGVISPAYVNLRAKTGFEPRYYDYYFKTQYWNMGFFVHGKGVSFENRWTLNDATLKDYYIPMPSLSEQQIIADYLDEECSKIDEIIAEANASVEEYKELRIAAVNDAVTHGIYNNATKDSNVDWIGKIPDNWDIIITKRLFKIKKDIAGKEGYKVLSITQKGIVPKVFGGKGQFAADYSNYQIVNKGDFAMNHMDLLTGWLDISEYDGVTSPDYRVFVPTGYEDIYTPYYKYVMQNCYSCKIYYGLGHGVAGMGRWRLPADMFLNFKLPMPPKTEQKDIADFLDKRTAEIDSLIAEKESLINDLEAYKKSLIYEVVTGKRRVV